MINKLFTYLFLVFVGLSSVVLYFAAVLIRIITYFFDKRLIILNLFTSFWGSLYTWTVPAWSVKIFGREKMDIKRNYIIVSNHQSQLDILVAHRLFYPVRWVSKAEIFNIPFIGWNMVLNNHVGIKRGDKQSSKKMMADCEKILSENASLYFFPEGTRSKTGIMKDFKPGAFILAKKMKKALLPVVLNGTTNALPKHSFAIRGWHKMEARVLDPIEYEIFADMEIDEISAMVKNILAKHIYEHQSLNKS